VKTSDVNQERQKYITAAFYNLENFFDFNHDAYTLDEDFTTDGDFAWDEDRYQTKIRNISRSISQIGRHETEAPPAVIGVAEVENAGVLEDLIGSEELQPFNYDFVHYDSPDERGIDVAFLYRKDCFELDYSDTYPLMLKSETNDRDYTRDVLLISGKLDGVPVYIIVNHWPSRNKGVKFSESKRFSAARLIHKIIREITNETANPEILIMGDFNDNPNSNSIKNQLVKNGLFNPMYNLYKKGIGSLYHARRWHLFDQIILTDSFRRDGMLQFRKAIVVNDYFLQDKSGKNKGAPLRTFLGTRYVGGYSDHFPVCVLLEKKS
jgi:hypothetical protein